MFCIKYKQVFHQLMQLQENEFKNKRTTGTQTDPMPVPGLIDFSALSSHIHNAQSGVKQLLLSPSFFGSEFKEIKPPNQNY